MFDLTTLNGKTFPLMQVWQVVVTQNPDGTYTATEPTNYGASNPVGESAMFKLANNHHGTIVWQESVPSPPVTWTVLGGTGDEFLMYQGFDLAHGIELIVSTSTVTPASGSVFGANSVNPCFVAGTLIETPSGAVAVETLSVGDHVLTAADESRAIVWVGRRQVECSSNVRPELVWPICIRAGAFGLGLPRRDLLVSPDHCLFLNGALIPAKLLQNGSTVCQVPMASVTYCHVELSTHDVLLAEGLPAESYLDTGNRSSLGTGRIANDVRPAKALTPARSAVGLTGTARTASIRVA